MSEKKSFDLVVLGGGPGGYTAAFRAADLGLKVCLVEQKNRLGGVCLNVGCIPSKTLLHAAAVMEEAEEAADFGVVFSKPEVDIEALRGKKEEVISQLTNGLESLCKARKVTRITGTAKITAANSIVVTGQEADEEIECENMIIATGVTAF